MITIEVVKCLDKSLHRIVGYTENQINRLDYRITHSQPGRWPSLYSVFQLLYINLLVVLFAGAYVAIERGFIATAHSFPWLADLLHELALFGFILSMFLLLRHRLHLDKEVLRSELATWRIQHDEDRQRLRDFVSGYKGLVEQAFQEGLTRAESHALVKNFFGLATPPNRDLALKLDRLADELPLTLRLTRLEQPTLRVFQDLMGSPILDQNWGQLFFAFAIHLQLKPWVTAASHETYQFTRYYDDVCYLWPIAEQAKLRYNQLVREDLEAILKLVNGKLWSVMFRDIDVWSDPIYYKSNNELLERTKHRGTDVRRLFLFEQDWLDDDAGFKALAGAAIWHLEHNYDSRFAQKNKVTSTIVSLDDHYVASCLLNSTRIIMSQSPIPRAKASSKKGKMSQYDWFRYRCDVNAADVGKYENDFLSAWSDDDALKPEEFLKVLEAKNLATLEKTRKWVKSVAAL